MLLNGEPRNRTRREEDLALWDKFGEAYVHSGRLWANDYDDDEIID